MIISEKEYKLSINASDGKKITEALGQLDDLGDFNIRNSCRFDIQDSYLDTNKFSLAKNGAYLRFRGKANSHLITVRKSNANFKGSISIDEITHPLNDKGVNIVLSELAKNYKINKEPQLIYPNFHEIFQSIGFHEVLRVVLNRQEFEIYFEDVKVGKMKIDIFNYTQPNKFGPFYEIEIDSYKKVFYKSTDEFVSALVAEYEKGIERSMLSKYIRGLNIAYGLNLK